MPPEDFYNISSFLPQVNSKFLDNMAIKAYYEKSELMQVCLTTSLDGKWARIVREDSASCFPTAQAGNAGLSSRSIGYRSVCSERERSRMLDIATRLARNKRERRGRTCCDA